MNGWPSEIDIELVCHKIPYDRMEIYLYPPKPAPFRLVWGKDSFQRAFT